MRITLTLAVATIVTTLAACGGNNSPDAVGKDDGSLSRVRGAGKLTVCSSNDVPYFYRDPKSGQLTGTDYDMIKAIAERIGVPKVELYEVPISGIIPALNSRRCDIIGDNIAITIKRSKEVDFSAPMYRAGQALVVPKGNRAKILTQDDFGGHSVGSYQGTVQLDYLKELAKKDPTIRVKEYKNITEIVADLEAGRLDAGAFDDMVAAAMIKANPSLGIEVINYKLPIGDYTVGAAFRKGDVALRHAFNDGNQQVARDGTLSQIFAKWGLTPAEKYEPYPGCCAPPA
ncbi:substrate-binding periplasmic protein [Phytohabitans aurantiacus]|uniref:Amino acid ABC transporter substrate-binding protein n=1 Tax=Phytohabitans aurantiacus TaxID=3016789 RepID=A0ABQ5RCG9_9ACTN|nr:ABC transporter substrate-binding protein [Phytohabitans aurantiacus]GLI03862.1 amino acid ABC transporter substrate-binding protein [Phytohabitans aurantiacus]